MGRSLSLESRTAIIFAVAVIVRAAFHYLSEFTADDAFITFRYAENIARGLGFVYNEGEPVLGTTTPLFTFLLSFLAMLHIPVPQAAIAISLAASGFTALLLYRMALWLRFTRHALLPVTAYILWPRSLPADTCGMETALFTALITAAFYYQMRRQEIFAIGLATLATLARPEGGWLLLLIFIVAVIQHPKRRKFHLMVPAILLIPWILFASFYFGSPLPNSIIAKLALYDSAAVQSWWERTNYVMGFNNPVGWLLIPLSIVGWRWLYRTQNYGILPLVWLIGMMLFYIGSGTHLFFWYVAPLYPIYLLFATAAAPAIFERLHLRKKALRLAVGAIRIGAVVILLLGCYRPLVHYRNNQQLFDNVHKQIGLYLWRTAERDALVAAEDIGYLGYFSQLRLLDRDGLVSPQAVPFNRKGQYLQLILDYKPQYVVAAIGSAISPFINDPVFLKRFHPEQKFAFGTVEYILYSQNSP